MLKRSNIRRTLAAAAIGALLSGIFALGTPAASWAEGAETLPSGSDIAVSTSADEVGLKAHPTGCRYQIPDTWGSVASCSSHHGGSYRAVVLCRHSDGRISEYVGGWRQTGWSRAYCEGDSRASSAGFETSYYDRT